MNGLDWLAVGAAVLMLVSSGFVGGAWWAAARVRTILNRIDEQWREW